MIYPGTSRGRGWREGVPAYPLRLKRAHRRDALDRLTTRIGTAVAIAATLFFAAQFIRAAIQSGLL